MSWDRNMRMVRTNISLDEKLHAFLSERALRETQRSGEEVSLAKLIREAIRNYFRKELEKYE